MNAEPSSKFSFSFTLAALLHILLLSIFMLSMNNQSNPPTTVPTQALQATLSDEQAVVLQIEHANYLTHIPKPKLTRAEKRRLAREKKAAERLAAKQKKALAKSLKAAEIKPKTTEPVTEPVVETISVEPVEKIQTEAEKKAAARERWLKKVAARKKAEQEQQAQKTLPVEQNRLQVLPVVPSHDKKTHSPKKQPAKASPPSAPPQKETELPTLF